jgi:hypothetical protein
MKNNESQPDCQIRRVHYISDGPQESIPLAKSLRLSVRKSLGPTKVKMIKKYADDFLNWYDRLRGKVTKPPELYIQTSTKH